MRAIPIYNLSQSVMRMIKILKYEPSCRSKSRSHWPRGLRCRLRPLACWDCGFESHRGMDICLLWVMCVVRQRSLRRADHSSRGVLPTVVRRCVWSRNLLWMRRPWPTGELCAPPQKKSLSERCVVKSSEWENIAIKLKKTQDPQAGTKSEK